jgi:hypothetical protein
MTLSNPAPRFIYQGINDLSPRAIPVENETFAQHLPLIRNLFADGPEGTFYLGPNSGSFTDIFGAESFNERGKFFNNQMVLLQKLIDEGNGVMIKRLRPDDAGNPARITVAIDIVADDIPQTATTLPGFTYPDNGDGEFVTDAEGEIQTVAGYRARLVLLEDNTGEIGQLQPQVGSLVSSSTGNQSMIYPLFEMPVQFFGKNGDLNGLRMWCPTTRDTGLPFDEAASIAFKTRIYRLQFVRRDVATSSPVTVRTRLGEEYTDVSFMPGTYSETDNRDYYVGDVLIDQYEDDGLDTGTPPKFSPFSEFHVYQENVEAVQQMIYEKELEINPAAESYLLGPGMVDIFTGREMDGDAHMALHLEGALSGGIQLGERNVVYATGGSDGTVNLETYERLVRREDLNFGQLDDQYNNLAEYPFSVVYDTGLSMEGKEAMATILGRRRDVRCVFTTDIESDKAPATLAQEISRLQAISAMVRAYPESVLYGTGTCRADIILQSGTLVGSQSKRRIPQVIDYAVRWAKYAGATTGVVNPAMAIDTSENKEVTVIKNLNVKYIDNTPLSEIWAAGGICSLQYDRRRQYYPALQTVRNDPTSVLTSPITVAFCCDIARLIRFVHADFSGDTTLDAAQLIERADERILELLNGRYGDRITIEPETYLTPGDEQRGFTWHCKVRVSANTSRTVMFFDLETYRRDA